MMADMSLCYTTSCAVGRECRRHVDRHGGLKPNYYRQSYSVFEHEKGADCYGFIREIHADRRADPRMAERP